MPYNKQLTNLGRSVMPGNIKRDLNVSTERRLSKRRGQKSKTEKKTETEEKKTETEKSETPRKQMKP